MPVCLELFNSFGLYSFYHGNEYLNKILEGLDGKGVHGEGPWQVRHQLFDAGMNAFHLLVLIAGGLNFIELQYPDGKTSRLTSKDLIRGVPKGTIFFQHASGGGGYGDPQKRPREKVAEEVANGVISKEAARDHYGLGDD